jgi:O-antigen ligase
MIRHERLAFGSHVFPSVPARPSIVAAALSHEPSPVRLSRIETWDWGWGGLLLFSLALFFRPQDQIAGLGNAHLSELAAIIGLTAMVFLNLSRRQPITRVTPELLGVFALWGVMLATVPTSLWPGGSFLIFRRDFLPIAFLFMLFVNCGTSPRRIERICRVIVLAFGYMCVRVIFNYVRGIGLVEGDRASGPVGGFFENPNDLALNLAAFLPLALMYVKRPGPVLMRLVSAGIACLMLVVVVLTKSRGGLLGTIAMLIVFLLVSRSLTPGMLLALVVAGMLILPALPQSFLSRMATITEGETDPGGSREERKQLLKNAWAVFLEYPLTGVGAGQFQTVELNGRTLWRETHNAPLQVATELGIFGAIAFFFLIYRGFGAAIWTRKRLSWIYRRRPGKQARSGNGEEDGLSDRERVFLQTHGAAMVASLTGWFVCSLFASVAFNWTFYYVLGLSVTARDVIRARAHAYARAKELVERERVVA